MSQKNGYRVQKNFHDSCCLISIVPKSCDIGNFIVYVDLEKLNGDKVKRRIELQRYLLFSCLYFILFTFTAPAMFLYIS